MPIDDICAAALEEAAWQLADNLQRYQTPIVFAESCTAGLVSATLATVPGISQWLCGSAVTYQEATKISWLGVHPQDLENFTAVSEQIAHSMAVSALRITPNADIAVAVTGHLGPNAPAELDAVIFIGTAVRTRASISKSGNEDDQSRDLRDDTIKSLPPERIILRTAERRLRQVEASIAVLEIAAKLSAAQK